MSSTVYKVFIGSTSKDLPEYREAAAEICDRVDMKPVHMETFPAMELGATAGSLTKLDEADVYIGIFGFRYGYIENPADGRGVTEIEFDTAGEKKVDRLCFLAKSEEMFDKRNFDPENRAKLDAFHTKVKKEHIVDFFADINDFRVRLMQALIEWKQRQIGIATVSTVVVGTLAQDAADLKPYKPSKLIGRDKLLGQIAGWIANGDKILLHGFGGMGKTALAATAAAQFLDAESGRRVVWARIRSQSVAEIFIGLAHAFGPDAARQLTATPDEHKPRALRDLLQAGGVKLVVLDDAWDGPALFAALRVLPDDLPVVVTSRHRYPMEGQIAAVDKLGPNDAVAVLAYYAGRDDLKTDHDAFALCKTLGHHAFALEIAGKTLRADGIPPDVLEQRIHDTPDQLTMPLDFAEPERESVAKLLEASLNELDDEAKAVFLAFGAFFVPSATPELLARFLASPSLVGEGDKGGEVLPALTTLVRRGLADYIPSTDEAVATYRVHDLAQSYARAQHSIETRQRALQACLDYTGAYNEPSLANFAALVPEIDQFVAASQWALTQGRLAAIEEFAGNLFVNSKVLQYRGYPRQAIIVLTLAATAAEQQGKYKNQSAYLGNLANTYMNLGEIRNAVTLYEYILQIQRILGDKTNEIGSLGNIAVAYTTLGEVGEAIKYFELALALASKIGDKDSESIFLGNLGIAYSDVGEVEKSINLHISALQIAHNNGNRLSESSQLGSLGNIYLKAGKIHEAIPYYEQSLKIAYDIGNIQNQTIGLVSLGNCYLMIGNTSLAIECFQKASTILESSDDKVNLGYCLNSLGAACERLGKYDQAMNYLQRALEIFKAIGVKSMIKQVSNNIAIVEAKLRGE